MALMQTRWICHLCGREWLDPKSAVGANPWSPDHGCPGCHSPQIEERSYRPMFPGGDIPRGAHEATRDLMPPTPTPSIVQPPPHALIATADEDALAAQWEALGRS